jgi:hypothetical protein
MTHRFVLSIVSYTTAELTLLKVHRNQLHAVPSLAFAPKSLKSMDLQEYVARSLPSCERFLKVLTDVLMLRGAFSSPHTRQKVSCRQTYVVMA